jgi:predicted porin
MTLLGVGGPNGGKSGTATTLGGIGTGYIYPAWKGLISYTTPNMNGFEATIAITNPNQFPATDTTDSAVANTSYQDRFGVEGQVQYSWTGDVAGKVWSSFATYDVQHNVAGKSHTANVYDVGASVTTGNLGLVGYYYNGEGVGTTVMGNLAYDHSADKERDSDGGYIQATYVIPTGTKLGVSYGVSNLDKASGEGNSALVDKNERWTVGAYHPLTKHLNLVAEYNKITSEGQSSAYENESFSFSSLLCASDLTLLYSATKFKCLVSG